MQVAVVVVHTMEQLLAQVVQAVVAQDQLLELLRLLLVQSTQAVAVVAVVKGLLVRSRLAAVVAVVQVS
jgi:hypothetical protein